ncbi:MAG TPA: hypothetical protein VGB04_03685 [Allosphingosinicella sp.]
MELPRYDVVAQLLRDDDERRRLMNEDRASGVLNPSIAERGRMFLGTFDDSVSRNPWGFQRTDANNLTNTLIYHALLGPRLCARVGNILYHQPYFEAFRSHQTPLLAFAETGFFQFHMKGESFNNSIERRRLESTNSTLAWIKQTGWSIGSDVYRALDDLQARAGSHGVRRYSPSFHALFQVLADRAVPEGTPEYREMHALWTARASVLSRTRSEFEKLCDATYGPGSPGKASAMSTINSVNHYAYALAMHEITEERDEIPLVETSEIKSFNTLTRSLVDSGMPLNEKHLQDLIEGEVFEVVHRNLRVPLDLFHRPENWAKLASYVGTAGGNREFVELKREVLVEIRRALEGGPKWHGPLALERACREYSRKLCGDLGQPSSKLGAVAMTLGLDRFAAAGIKDGSAEVLSDATKKGIVGGATAAGYAMGGPLGGVAGWVAGAAVKTWANVVIDLLSESTVYHTRRIVDRVRYEGLDRSIGPRRYSQEKVLPLVQALCVKQVTREAISAAQKNEVGQLLDASPPDLF